IDLGSLGGGESQAVAIDDRGRVVGYSTTATGAQHAFLWQNGKMTDLGTLPGVAGTFNGVENEQFVPTGINDRGQIVGLAHDPIGSFEVGWLWQKGKLSTFAGLGR